MADNNVQITGIDPNAMKDALSDVPPWATEETASKIESILKKSLGIQTKTLTEIIKKFDKNADSDALKALSDEANKLLKGFVDLSREQQKQKRRNKETEEQFEQQKKRAAKEETMSRARAALEAKSLALGLAVKQAMIDNANTFDMLYASGVNVLSGFNSAASGFEALQQLATITGVRFTELGQTIAKYNAAVNSITLERFAKTVSAASMQMTRFGFNSKETAELLGLYIESQKGYTDVRNRTEEETVSRLVKFGERIRNVSLATGMLRTQILANLEALSKHNEMTLLSGQIGGEAAEKTAEFIASFKDQNIGMEFLKMMTAQIKPLNSTFMSFQKIGFGNFGQRLMAFQNSLRGLSAEEAKKRQAEFVRANRAEIMMMNQRAGFMAEIGRQEGQHVGAITSALLQIERDYKEVSAAEREKAEQTSQATKDLQNAWETFKAQLQITFMPTTQLLGLLTKGLVYLNDFFEYVRNLIKSAENFLNGIDELTQVTGKIDLLPWIGVGLMGLTVLSGVTLLAKALFFGAKTILSIPASIAGGIVKSASKSDGWIRKIFTSLWSATKTVGSFLLSSVKFIGNAILKVAPFILRLLGPIALLYTAFQLGKAIGQQIYETLSQFEFFNNSMAFIFSNIEKSWETLSGLPDTIRQKLDNFGNAVSEAYTNLKSKLSNGANVVKDTVVSTYKKASSFMADKISNGALYVKDKLTGAYDSITEYATEVYNRIPSDILNKMSTLSTFIRDKGRETFGLMRDALEPVARYSKSVLLGIGSRIAEAATKAGDAVKQYFSSWMPWIDKIKDALSTAYDLVKGAFSNIVSFAESFVDNLKNFLIEVAKKFFSNIVPESLQFWKKSEENTGTSAPIKKEESGAKIGNVSLPPMTSPQNAVRIEAPKAVEIVTPTNETKPLAQSVDEKPFAKKTDLPSGSGIRKENVDSEINSALAHQSSVLERLLQSSNDLVSVNREILRYVKVQT